MSAGCAQTLAGSRALITGGGRGIGRAIAEAYARAGSDIVVVARTQSDVDEVAAIAKDTGVEALAIAADVSDEGQIEMLFARIADTGGLDIAVLNAGGIPGRGPVAGSATDHWRATFDQNFFGSYFCARAAIPLLRARGGGKIIFMGSGLGHRGLPDFAAYSCAKAAQWMFTRVLAQELAGEAISVNEIVPGPVNTTIGTRKFDPGKVDRFAAEWAKEPAEVARLAVMIASLPDHGASAQSFKLLRRDG